jgi:hypothetical protein
MDSWYNGKLDMAPGITPYGPWRVESWATGQGPWDLKWPYKSLYPAAINNWPGHERWFNNYTCPLNAEFTIHQNTVLNASTFGFLCAASSAGFVPNRRPEIHFTSPEPDSMQSDTVLITVNATDPDGDTTIFKVEYYNGWHKIGESGSFPYTLHWHNTFGGMLKLTAQVFDQYGLIGRTDTLVINSTITDLPLQADYYFTRLSVPRTMDEKALEARALARGISGSSFPSVKEAWTVLKEKTGPNDLVVITGSTFLVADFLGLL